MKEKFDNSKRDFLKYLGVAASLIAAGFMGWQTFLLRQEIEYRTRPWIGRKDMVQAGVTTEKGYIHYEKYREEVERGITLKEFEMKYGKPLYYHFKLFLKNYGELPALNVIGWRKEFNKKPPSEIKWPKESIQLGTVIMPGEEIPIPIIIPADEWNSVHEGKDELYIAIRVEYEFETKKCFYEATFMLDPFTRNFTLISSKAQ
jgi:hypothetical protein